MLCTFLYTVYEGWEMTPNLKKGEKLMSGHTEETKCEKCGELAELYVESPPVPCKIISCTNYECGFKSYIEDGKDISYYQEKWEIKDLREIWIEE